jgi:hypothetical protein
VRVAVSQQIVARDAAARASALRALMPILFLVPLLVLLVECWCRYSSRSRRCRTSWRAARCDLRN